MDVTTRQLRILCLAALVAAIPACASNSVSQCEATGILCPSGMHCAAAEPICIADTNLCGDAHKDPAEECDDGNTKDGDGCSHECKIELCGNGRIDFGEVCDNAGDNGKCKGCAADCRSFEACGDGVVDTACGEVCDDHNTAGSDGCAGNCKSTEVCGNHIIDSEVGEVCDDGDKNGTPGDPCSANCRSNLSCNNGIVDPGEECDHGTFGNGNAAGNDDHNDCRADCQFNRCGDGHIDAQAGPRHEQCDDGHLNGLIPIPTETVGCNIDCTLPSCGDGKINRSFTPQNAPGPEQCDNGTANNNNADCTAQCQTNVCGDGNQDTTGTNREDCDHGANNGVVGDTCTKDCHLVSCGNSVLDPGEECDDGAGNDPNHRCNKSCKLNFCGDGKTLTGVEQCDDGDGTSAKDSTTCDHDCTSAVCGDGYQNATAGEQCDDGASNGKVGSQCSFTCKTIDCGNGVIEQGEDCDDGSNNGIGKRCNSSCKFNVCGDGDPLTGVEQCDKGTSDTATCDADCTFAVCGDGHKNMAAGEACDEGTANGTAVSMCDAFCKLKGCGNGIVEPGEQCDPGAPAADTMNCNFDCTLPVCGDGHRNMAAGEACDDGPDNGNPCDYNDQSCQRCNATCTAKVSPGGPFCGDAQPNGTTQHPEVCDQGPLNGTLCAYGDTTCLSNANALCKADCSGFAGALHGTYCGDATVQSPQEECDPGGHTLTPANTAACDSDCTFPVCGDGHTNGQANEACDDRNTSACGTCSADCTTITSSVATGKIIAVGAIGTNIADGDTFTLNDGFKQKTFEFDSGGGVTGTNAAIGFAANDTAATVAGAMIAAINLQTTVAITASLGTSAATVNLANDRKTSHGNQTIAKTGGILTSFQFTGMSGGQGGDCDAGIGCKVGDDCSSGTCSNGRCQ
jgi:cysteine-rich repeat protein